MIHDAMIRAAHKKVETHFPKLELINQSAAILSNDNVETIIHRQRTHISILMRIKSNGRILKMKHMRDSFLETRELVRELKRTHILSIKMEGGAND